MYERVAGLQLQAGKTVDALNTYKVVADADPAAVSRRLRLAELYSRERRVPGGRRCVSARRRSAASRRGVKSDYVRVAERLLYHDGGRPCRQCAGSPRSTSSWGIRGAP